MPLIYTLDVLSALKDKGLTTYKLRKDKLLSESTIQKLRNGEPISWENIELLCFMLHCQPGNLLKFHSSKRFSPAGPFTPPEGERCTPECARRGEVIKSGCASPWCYAYGVKITDAKCEECLRE